MLTQATVTRFRMNMSFFYASLKYFLLIFNHEYKASKKVAFDCLIRGGKKKPYKMITLRQALARNE